jgi:hypothetical protein
VLVRQQYSIITRVVTNKRVNKLLLDAWTAWRVRQLLRPTRLTQQYASKCTFRRNRAFRVPWAYSSIQMSHS